MHDKEKMSRPVITSTVVAALGGLLFGFDTAVISGTTDALQSYFGLSEAMLGFTVASALIGTVAGSIIASRPSDIWGRNRVLFVIAGLYTVSALGSGLAWSLHSFWFFRFIGGLAVGGASVVSPMYIAEIAPAGQRGRLVGWQQFNVCFGICLAYVSNFLVATCPLFSDSIQGWAAQWRWMFMMETFPALAFWCLLALIPQSPRWLVEQQRPAEALSVLEKLGAADPRAVLDEIVESMHRNFDAVHARFWQAKYALPITAAVALAVFNQLSGINALLYYAPKVFGMGGSDNNLALLQSIPVGLMLVFSTVIGLALIDRLGRKTLLIAGSLGMALFLALVGLTFARMTDGEQVSNSVMWLFVGYLFFFGPSTGAVIWVYISEIFPNRVRAKGQSLGSFTHWFMAAVVSQVFPVAAACKAVGPGKSFLFFAVCMLAQALFVWKVLPETKGVSLEQLQKRLGIE